ncbi:fructoselysine 6-kinase [Bacillus sp. FJAT-49711]|uniref:fructoselysine 6-kinase n=1 Tax=Bacillus sp. FJAT-49711 TaxID=2833585 RepID=UPI001BC9DDFF|nr:fructoselysine 6-kinase [Bacillus sp. FJAT-49711]MBS4218470.1 fructoselysine 6-kinase [Bacillus sp. FJAT-49711]
MRIITVGDNCMDVYQPRGEAYPGGNPVNVAVFLKRLGARSAYIGWVGSDSYGEVMKNSISEKGVDVSHLSKKEGKTAISYVELVNNERCFGDYYEGVMADFILTREELDFIGKHLLVHAGIYGHVEGYYPLFKEMGVSTSFDFSDKLDHHLVESLPKFVDYSFFSYTKDDSFIREYLMNINTLGSPIAVATLGENGSIAYDGENFYTCCAVDSDVIDTMGAGDSFIAGFIYGRVKGLSITDCLDLGSKMAAETIRYFGAW